MLSDGSIVDSATLPPNAVESYPVNFAGASVHSTASLRTAPASEHLGSMTASGFEAEYPDRPAAYRDRSVADTGALRTAPASGAGPYFVSSDNLGSIQGHPVIDSGGTLADPGSLVNSGESLNQGGRFPRSEPINQSGAISVRSAPGSTMGPGVDYSSETARTLAQEFPMTFSGMSMSDTAGGLSTIDSPSAQMQAGSGQLTDTGSVQSSQHLPQEYPLTFSGGSGMQSMMASSALRTAPGSVSGYPLNYSMESGSDGAAGPPLVTSTGLSTSGALQSAPGSVRGHPLTMTDRSLVSSHPGRGELVRLSDGRHVYSSYVPPESLGATGLPYMESTGLESLPEGSVLDSVHEGNLHQYDSLPEASAAGLVEQSAGSPLLASSSGVRSSGTAMRSAPGSVRGGAQRMDLSSSDSARGKSSPSDLASHERSSPSQVSSMVLTNHNTLRIQFLFEEFIFLDITERFLCLDA